MKKNLGNCHIMSPITAALVTYRTVNQTKENLYESLTMVNCKLSLECVRAGICAHNTQMSGETQILKASDFASCESKNCIPAFPTM